MILSAHGKDGEREEGGTARQTSRGRLQSLRDLAAPFGLACRKAVPRASGEAEGGEMTKAKKALVKQAVLDLLDEIKAEVSKSKPDWFVLELELNSLQSLL